MSEELLESMTRFKRKSLDVDMDDGDYSNVGGKRFKYERSVFAISANERRGHLRTASWSRRNA